jgi:hypothetical protein
MADSICTNAGIRFVGVDDRGGGRSCTVDWPEVFGGRHAFRVRIVVRQRRWIWFLGPDDGDCGIDGSLPFVGRRGVSPPQHLPGRRYFRRRRRRRPPTTVPHFPVWPYFCPASSAATTNTTDLSSQQQQPSSSTTTAPAQQQQQQQQQQQDADSFAGGWQLNLDLPHRCRMIHGILRII